MTENKCPECGAVVIGGRAGCQALFDEVGLRSYSDLRYAATHRLVVDAYCMQHPEPYCHSAKSYAAHLTGLCCGVEQGGDSRIYRATQQWLNGKVKLEKPEAPDQRGKITVTDLYAASNVEQHKKLAHDWAHSVWEAYAAQHGLAFEWIRAALGEKENARAK